ncbi:hypothetical protein Drorol1_Dr00020089, partial [Drosera rotundifolia]
MTKVMWRCLLEVLCKRTMKSSMAMKVLCMATRRPDPMMKSSDPINEELRSSVDHGESILYVRSPSRSRSGARGRSKDSHGTRSPGKNGSKLSMTAIIGDAIIHSLNETKMSTLIYDFKQFKKLGKDSPAQPRLPSKNDVAVIMYTSDNTEMPKGVMMTHGNIVATAIAVTTVVP